MQLKRQLHHGWLASSGSRQQKVHLEGVFVNALHYFTELIHWSEDETLTSGFTVMSIHFSRLFALQILATQLLSELGYHESVSVTDGELKTQTLPQRHCRVQQMCGESVCSAAAEWFTGPRQSGSPSLLYGPKNQIVKGFVDLDPSCTTPAVCFWLFYECQVTVFQLRSVAAERICHHSRDTSCWLRTQKRSVVVSFYCACQQNPVCQRGLIYTW